METQRYNEIYTQFVDYIIKKDLHVGTMQNANMAWNDFNLFEVDLPIEEQREFTKVFSNNLKGLIEEVVKHEQH